MIFIEVFVENEKLTTIIQGVFASERESIDSAIDLLSTLTHKYHLNKVSANANIYTYGQTSLMPHIIYNKTDCTVTQTTCHGFIPDPSKPGDVVSRFSGKKEDLFCLIEELKQLSVNHPEWQWKFVK